jgi:DNA mismatch repair protein MutL
VPARRNFLKSDKIEFSHITDEFLRVALAHPSISFKLSHNGTVLYDLRDAVLRRRIVDVLGKNSNDRLVPIEETTDIVELHGFVLKPEFSKKTRGEQYFFVNDRFFKSSYFNHAITKAYEGLLKEGYFPSFFVYLKVPNHKIDVNVHPTKTEIKFEEEKFIYSILLSSIRQALGKFNISPTLDFDRESSFDLPLSMRDQPVTEPKIAVNPDFNPFRSESSRASQGVGNGFTTAIKNAGFGKDLNFDQKDWASFYEIKEEKPNDPIKLDLNTDTDLDFIVKGNYVFIPSQLGITVINARRAYELIVHSELFKNFIVKPLDSQILLFPISIELSRTQETLWMDNEMLLRQMGFSFSLSNGDLQIEAVPEILQDETIQPCIEEILQTLEFEDITVRDLAQSVLINIARSSAMKRMDLQNKEYTRQLIVRLYELGEFETTLDGRKVVSTISLEELGNKFN